MTEVSTEFLRKAADLLFSHVEETHGSRVVLDPDYFWSIPNEQLNNVYQASQGMTIGQYSECVENLRTMLTEEDATLSYGLVWLGELIKAVGHRAQG